MSIPNISNLLFFGLILVMSGCGNADPEKSDSVPAADSVTMITSAQFESEKMQLGTPEHREFREVLHLAGRLTPAANSVVEVNTQIPGMIKNLQIQVGSYVQKGQKLCILEGKEIIKLQEEFLASMNEFRALEQDYQRIKTLSKDNIAAGKDLVAIESRYLIQKAKIAALKAEMDLVGIEIPDTEKISIHPDILLHAPISGYITKLACTTGEYVSQEKMLMEITDMSQLEIHFTVFEKDITRIKPGLALHYWLPADPKNRMNAFVKTVGKSVDPEDRTLLCTASLDRYPTETLANGLHVEVEVFTDKKQALALPDEAILKSEESTYLLFLKEKNGGSYYFVKREIVIGESADGYTEVTGFQGKEQVLIKGAFNLQGE